jgi:hypothetical protein
MKLIPQARKWYRMFSVQALMLIGAIEATAQGVAAIYGQKMLDVAIPLLNVTGSEIARFCALLGVLAGVAGRLIDQGHTTQNRRDAL